jgi:succinate-acetate transporter protein
MATATPVPGPGPEQPIRLVPPVEEPIRKPLAGDPSLVALPSFIVGAVAFGMVLIGVVPVGAVGAALPILLTAAVGMFLATIWAARLGESAQAGIFGIVAGFFLSYALLVLGLSHSWYALLPAAVISTQKVFVISWIVIVTMLVLATLRLPMAYTALFAVVDVALVLNLIGIIQTSENMTKAAGWVSMGFTAIAVYLFFSSASHATGGKELPLGRPLLHT